MTERAIDKMVEWLKNNMEDIGNGIAPKDILFEAMRLADEEAKEKPTAPACPTCGVGVKLTERRIDGNSTCFNGHTHKTKDFYRPTPQADVVVEPKYCDPKVPCSEMPCPFKKPGDKRVPCYEKAFKGGINKYNCPQKEPEVCLPQTDVVEELKELVRLCRGENYEYKIPASISVGDIEEIIRKHEGAK